MPPQQRRQEGPMRAACGANKQIRVFRAIQRVAFTQVGACLSAAASQSLCRRNMQEVRPISMKRSNFCHR